MIPRKQLAAIHSKPVQKPSETDIDHEPSRWGQKGNYKKKKTRSDFFHVSLFPAYHARPQPNKINYGEPWDAFPSLTIIPVGTAFHPTLEHGIYTIGSRLDNIYIAATKTMILPSYIPSLLYSRRTLLEHE